MRNGPKRIGSGNPSISARNVADTRWSRHHTMVWLSCTAMVAASADGQVDTVGVEAHEPGDALGLGDRPFVAPGDVLERLAVDVHRPVRRLALERARRAVV